MQRSRRTESRTVTRSGRTEPRRGVTRTGKDAVSAPESGRRDRGPARRGESPAPTFARSSASADQSRTRRRPTRTGWSVPELARSGGPQSARARRGRPSEGAGDAALVTQQDHVEDYIVGRHPVLEALKAGRTINKMLLAEGAEGGSLTEIIGKAKAAGVIIQRAPRAKLDQIAGPHHQGVLLYVAPHDYAELDDIIGRNMPGTPLVVLLDEVEDPYNLGAVLRTAEATGVLGIIIPKRRSVPLTGTVAKVAAGALEHVPVARVTNLVQAMERLKQEGFWLVGADASATQLYTQVDYRGAVAVVIGAEGKGLSRLVKERCDHLVKLPMLGQLQSLNASVATGVLLYEVVRQRG